MGREENVWDEPMAFRRERFLDGGEDIDIIGSREIEMMPFGAGRWICPTLNLTMLQFQYFVVNLMREFEWEPVKGEEVDMSEKLGWAVISSPPFVFGRSSSLDQTSQKMNKSGQEDLLCVH